jgi:hypothetical protein
MTPRVSIVRDKSAPGPYAAKKLIKLVDLLIALVMKSRPAM